MRLSFLFSLAMVAFASGCSGDKAPADSQPAAKPAKEATVSARRHDENSFAEPDKVRITDLALDLALDFDLKQLAGTVTYQLDWVDPKANQLVLDTRDLTIEKAEAGGKDGQYEPLHYALAPADKLLGSKLTIDVPERNATVRVAYHTSPEASGLQWLAPSMTEGKQQPFMFSQSQQIHARSWVPLQDTTQVRFTYTAHVTAPKDAMVLMSGNSDPKAERDGDYSFTMPQKIPSYLLAIAAGDLVFRPTSDRSGVWAEPAMADKAQHEFEDTGKMIDAAEKLYGRTAGAATTSWCCRPRSRTAAWKTRR